MSLPMIWVTVLTALILLCLPLPILGADGFYDSNLAHCERVIKALGEEIQSYRLSDTSANQSLSQETGSAINVYRQKIIELQNSPEFSTEDLSAKIELLHAKAKGAGIATWVYRSRIYEYPSLADSASMTALYSEIKSELETATEPSALSEASSLYPQRLNRSAFASLIKSESKSGDSLSVNAIAEGAIDKLGKLSDTDPSGAAYREIYQRAIADMELRRTRDGLTSELKTVYQALYPTGDFNSDRTVALFVYHIEDKSLAKDMNKVLNNTISDLLMPFKTDFHTSLFAEGLIAEVASKVEIASELESIPAVGELFSDFSFGYSKARAKDTLAAHIAASPHKDSGELLAILTEYTQSNGIFDLTVEESEVAFELKRATLRVDWYGDFMSARSRISEILSPHDPSEMLTILENQYKSRDIALSAISFTDKNASLLADSEYADGQEAIEDIKTSAKAEKYLRDHSGVISAPADSIDASYLPLLKTAIADAIALEDKVAAKIVDTVRTLYGKYKLAMVAELEGRNIHPSASRLWENAVLAMSHEISAIPEALPPSEFQASINRALQRAETVREVIERFTEIISLEEYKSFSDTSKAALISSAQNACSVVLSADFTPISWEQRLGEAKASAMLILEKAYSSAHLITMAESAKDPGALPLARSAAARIESALTMEEVRALTLEADFSLSVILHGEKAEALAEALKKEINALAHLDPSQREDFCLETDEALPSISEAIREADSADALAAAFAEAQKVLGEIRSKALYEDLRNAKRQAAEDLLAEKELLKNEISTLIYASDSAKATLLSRLDTETEAFHSRMTAAESAEELLAIQNEAAASREKMREDKNSSELNACRATVMSSYNSILALRDRYSDENYNKIKDIINTSALFVESCANVTELISEREAVLGEIEKISTLLDDTKADAIERLDELFGAMSKKKDLYSAERFELLEKTYRKAVSDISGETKHEYRDRVSKLLSDAIAAMSTIPLDRIQTADGLILSANGALSYPEGYSISSNGYPAYIQAEGKIPYGGTLKLISLPVTDKQGLPRKLAGDKKIYSQGGLSLSADTLKLLKRSEFVLGFRVDTSLEFDGETYRLTFLLPDGTSPEDVVGIIGLSSSQSGVFYNYTLDGLLMTIDIQSPGDFYLALRKDTSPILIILIIGLLILVLLCFTLARYLRYRGTIPFFQPINEESPATASPTTAIEVVRGNRQPVKKTDKPQKPVRSDRTGKSPAESGKYNADKANSHPKENAKAEEASRDHGQEKKEKSGRAEINLDLIAANFNAGEVVTLEALIEKKLLPPGAKWYKVLARGKINKPLTVIAQDFSSSAIKAILLAGGSATVAEELDADNEAKDRPESK